jgi:MFS family permease
MEDRGSNSTPVSENSHVRGVTSFSLARTFAALKYPNYRLWFAGQLASLVGTWMQTTAQGFLVFQLTNSPTYLGVVGFVSGIPSWIFMLYGGVVADRMPRRTLLVITQTSMLILAFILAALTFAGLVQPWHIVLLAFLLGVANAFDTPARQSFVLEMIEREDLGNAIALNATMFQSAVVVGPAVAGITYALFGPAWCFTINGLSFVAVIAALLKMRLKPVAVRARVTSIWQDLSEGVRYIVAHPVIRTIIVLVSVTSLFATGFITLFPDWAVIVLNGDATTNGWLQSARGLGSLLGALMIASLGRFTFKGKLLTTGTIVFPLSLILFALIGSLAWSIASLVIVGWAFMILFNMGNVLVQTHVEDEFRGRVMGVYSLTFSGLSPVGALFAGALAEQVGAPATVIVGAAITLVFALLVWWKVPRLYALE